MRNLEKRLFTRIWNLFIVISHLKIINDKWKPICKLCQVLGLLFFVLSNLIDWSFSKNLLSFLRRSQYGCFTCDQIQYASLLTLVCFCFVAFIGRQKQMSVIGGDFVNYVNVIILKSVAKLFFSFLAGCKEKFSK